jgi:hypothetical protein
LKFATIKEIKYKKANKKHSLKERSVFPFVLLSIRIILKLEDNPGIEEEKETRKEKEE